MFHFSLYFKKSYISKALVWSTWLRRTPQLIPFQSMICEKSVVTYVLCIDIHVCINLFTFYVIRCSAVIFHYFKCPLTFMH